MKSTEKVSGKTGFLLPLREDTLRAEKRLLLLHGYVESSVVFRKNADRRLSVGFVEPVILPPPKACSPRNESNTEVSIPTSETSTPAHFKAPEDPL
jgi:hypothetical protein